MLFATAVKGIFKKYPLISNCVTYGSMCVGAELSQQMAIRKNHQSSRYKLQHQHQHQYQNFVAFIDVEALKRYAIIGFCINPVLLFFWYKWLDRKYVGRAKRTIFTKIFMDQFVMTPPLYVIFFTSMSWLEGKENIFQECEAKFLSTFKTSCLFWLPVQFVNFYFVPNAARVIFVGASSFLWINILCWIKNKEAAPPPPTS